MGVCVFYFFYYLAFVLGQKLETILRVNAGSFALRGDKSVVLRRNSSFYIICGRCDFVSGCYNCKKGFLITQVAKLHCFQPLSLAQMSHVSCYLPELMFFLVKRI